MSDPCFVLEKGLFFKVRRFVRFYEIALLSCAFGVLYPWLLKLGDLNESRLFAVFVSPFSSYPRKCRENAWEVRMACIALLIFRIGKRGLQLGL